MSDLITLRTGSVVVQLKVVAPSGLFADTVAGFRRDGLERVDVPPNATIAQLREEISRKLGIAVGDITLSRNQALVSICTGCTSIWCPVDLLKGNTGSSKTGSSQHRTKMHQAQAS